MQHFLEWSFQASETEELTCKTWLVLSHFETSLPNYLSDIWPSLIPSLPEIDVWSHPFAVTSWHCGEPLAESKDTHGCNKPEFLKLSASWDIQETRVHILLEAKYHQAFPETKYVIFVPKHHKRHQFLLCFVDTDKQSKLDLSYQAGNRERAPCASGFDMKGARPNSIMWGGHVLGCHCKKKKKKKRVLTVCMVTSAEVLLGALTCTYSMQQIL